MTILETMIAAAEAGNDFSETYKFDNSLGWDTVRASSETLVEGMIIAHYDGEPVFVQSVFADGEIEVVFIVRPEQGDMVTIGDLKLVGEI